MTSTGWTELARAVVKRRSQLGLTQEQITARGGPSTATLRLIESAGQESYRGRTLFALDLALGWDEGTSLAISRGEVDGDWPARVMPVTRDRDEPPGHSGEDDPHLLFLERLQGRMVVTGALAVATTDELVDEIRMRLRAFDALIRQPEMGEGDGDAEDANRSSAPTNLRLSEVDGELPAAAKTGEVEEPGEFNT